MRRAICLLLAIAAGAAAPARAATAELPGRLGMYAGAAPTATAAPSLPMLASQLDVHVRGAIVEVTVHQTFHNDADHVTEATYIFPLPEDAAVTAMAITTGARTIHAAIRPRAAAQQAYEAAVAAGVGAALLEQERPDVFTQTVAAIPAHGDVMVTLRYDTTARPRGDGSWQLVVPMVVAPRYVPGTASGRPTTGAGHAPDTDRAPDASRVTPGAKPGAGGATAIALTFADAVEGVTSPTHELAARGAGYALGDAHSDHDAVIRWRTTQAETGWVEQDADGGYAAAVVSASPARPRPAAAPPLELALILDRSAAAHGDADAAARPLVRELLAALTPADAVTVTGSARAAPADAWRELERTWASSPGAFDLTRALRAARGGAIVLITPGLVADDAAALAAARALQAPVHVIGVGGAPNRALLVAIARETGGTIRFVAPDDDVPAIARDVLADLSSPPATLAISWGALAASDVVPAALPRLGAGQARLVLARVRAAQAANGRARGDVFAIAMVDRAPSVPGELTARGPLARRWARERLGELLDARDVAGATALALRDGLLSPYTSMIAIGDEVVVRGGVQHTVSVPVAVPAGMRWQPLERELHVATKGDAADPDRDGDHDGVREAPEHKHGKAAPAPAKKTADAPKAQRAPAAPAAPAAPPAVAVAVAAAGAGEEEAVAASDDVVSPATPQTESVVQVSMFESPARRYDLGLGAGLTLSDPTGLVAITGGVELGLPRHLGLEASLWLVGGLHAQERLLGTYRWRAPRGSLALGLGGHVSDAAGLAAGPAAGLVLRHDVARHVGVYLRYDGALLFGGGGTTGEHALSLGVELLQW